jgi:hypoxanthine-DNA glycosylase
MPSAASLAAGYYYAHPRNAFWPIMSALFGLDLSAGSVGWDRRRELLLSNRVALWDTARACVREGSADASIRDAEPNDIPALLAACPDVRAICLNGRKAEALFRSLVLPRLDETRRAIPRLTLPSTSPARAEPLTAKLEAWRAILSILNT